MDNQGKLLAWVGFRTGEIELIKSADFTFTLVSIEGCDVGN